MFLFPNLRKLTAQTYALWSLKALTKLLSKTNQAKRCLVSNKIIHRANRSKIFHVESVVATVHLMLKWTILSYMEERGRGYKGGGGEGGRYSI